MTATKRLDIVRGLPGSGRSEVVAGLREATTVVLEPETLLPSELSPLSPVGESAVQSAGLELLDDSIRRGVAHIVVESSFPTAAHIRPFVQKALNSGHDVRWHEPATAWRLDPRELQQKTTMPVDMEELRFAAQSWESVESIEQVLASKTPNEDLAEAKSHLAELHELAESEAADPEDIADKKAHLFACHPKALARLHYLGYFDPDNREQVAIEYRFIRSLERGPEMRSDGPPDLSVEAMEAIAASVLSEAKSLGLTREPDLGSKPPTPGL